MDKKQIVIGFLIVYLVAMFIAFIILLISYSKKEWRLPPSDCPDFWVKQKNNGTTECYNIHKIKYGNLPPQTNRTFNIPTDNNDIIKQGITWDGITYAKYNY